MSETGRPAEPVAGRKRSGQEPGRPGAHRSQDKSGWYRPVSLTVDALGIALPVASVFHQAGQPHTAAVTATATLTWLAVLAAHRRYGRRWLGETRGVLTTLRDWLTLLGLLAVLRVLTGENSPPAVALLALLPAPLLTTICRSLTHRHLTNQRREAHAVQRALVVGEGSA
ncbi:sugar transferase, partial [Streptomyces sp. A73]|nr:sugar transferase [Streptomyces sp. A73]